MWKGISEIYFERSRFSSEKLKCTKCQHWTLKACANSDLQTVNAQDTPMPPPRKWMMPVALSMVMLSAFGWIEGTT
jgi:hypothetical protein